MLWVAIVGGDVKSYACELLYFPKASDVDLQFLDAVICIFFKGHELVKKYQPRTTLSCIMSNAE